MVLHLNRLTQTFCLAVLSPLFKLCHICIELVDVFQESFDQFRDRVVFAIGVDISLYCGNGAVSEL
jgi:hypothetical protein